MDVAHRQALPRIRIGMRLGTHQDLAEQRMHTEIGPSISTLLATLTCARCSRDAQHAISPQSHDMPVPVHLRTAKIKRDGRLTRPAASHHHIPAWFSLTDEEPSPTERELALANPVSQLDPLQGDRRVVERFEPSWMHSVD